MRDAQHQLRQTKGFDTKIQETIRGLEGTMSRIYFETLSAMLKPPYQFNGRSRQPAQDLFNAFLNYGYGILYSRVETALIKAGINPYVGFLHRDGYQFKSMVFDFIEPYRIYVDRTVVRLCTRRQLTKTHLEPKGKKGLYINKAGKQILVKAFLDLFDEQADQVNQHPKRTTPAQHLQASAHRFAKAL